MTKRWKIGIGEMTSLELLDRLVSEDGFGSLSRVAEEWLVRVWVDCEERAPPRRPQEFLRAERDEAIRSALLFLEEDAKKEVNANG